MLYDTITECYWLCSMILLQNVIDYVVWYYYRMLLTMFEDHDHNHVQWNPS
jgi:hypothetical protein